MSLATASPPKLGHGAAAAGPGSDYAASLRAYHHTLQAQILQDIWEPPVPAPAQQLHGGPSSTHRKERRRSSATRPDRRGQRRESSSGEGSSFSDKERRARQAEGEAVKRIRRQGFRQDSQDKVGSLQSLASKERILATAVAGIPAAAAAADEDDDEAPPACGSSISSSSCLSSALPVSPRSADGQEEEHEQHGDAGRNADREGSTTPPTTRHSVSLAALAEQERRAVAIGSLPMPKPPRFSRNKTSESIITIRSARSGASSVLDSYYLGSGTLDDGVSDSDESFVALAPSPMCTPGVGPAGSAGGLMAAGSLFGPPTSLAPTSSALNPNMGLLGRRQAPQSRNLKVEHLLAGRPLPSPLRIDATSEIDAATLSDAKPSLEPSDIADLRRSLAMKTIHTPAGEKEVVHFTTSVETSPAVLTPACEAPPAFANNPRAPRVRMDAAPEVVAASLEMRREEGSSSSNSSSDAATHRPFRRCTFQRPHHKNGRGKGRGGSYNEELELEGQA